MRKSMTKAQQAAYMLGMLAEATKPRVVGDLVKAKGGGVTCIEAIVGDAVTFANGEQWHMSKVRSATADDLRARDAKPAAAKKRAATPEVFTPEELDKVRRSLYCSWNAIASDIDEADFDNETAVEASADAGRMVMFDDKHGKEAQAIYLAAIAKHGYHKVQKFLTKNVQLV